MKLQHLILLASASTAVLATTTANPSCPELETPLHTTLLMASRTTIPAPDNTTEDKGCGNIEPKCGHPKSGSVTAGASSLSRRNWYSILLVAVRTLTAAPDIKVGDKACGHANEPDCGTPQSSSSDGTSLISLRNWYAIFLAGSRVNSFDAFGLAWVGAWLLITGLFAAAVL